MLVAVLCTNDINIYKERTVNYLPFLYKDTLSTFSYTPAPAAVSVLCECLSFNLILISYSGLFSML